MNDDSADALVAEMQVYYARRAAQYDSSMGYDQPSVIRALEPVAEALRDEMRGRAVLEIACGPGFWTERVAGAAREIVASDYNESVLALARERRIDSTHVMFVRADAYDLSPIAGTYDGAFAVDFFAHVPASRISGFLDGLHRRLLPGTRVAFCDQTPWPASVTGLRDAEGNHLQERTLEDGSRYRVIKHFFSDAELRATFASYCTRLDIRRFTEQRRIIVSYSLSQSA
jgi:ubiquinone/menaquinone biosynthesis C-methylase UbiE